MLSVTMPQHTRPLLVSLCKNAFPIALVSEITGAQLRRANSCVFISPGISAVPKVYGLIPRDKAKQLRFRNIAQSSWGRLSKQCVCNKVCLGKKRKKEEKKNRFSSGSASPGLDIGLLFMPSLIVNKVSLRRGITEVKFEASLITPVVFFFPLVCYACSSVVASLL